MIPRIVELLVLGIVLRQTQQLLLAEFQIVEFVLENDARLQEGFLYDGVARGLLIVCERNLRQIELAVMRIVGEGVCGCCSLRTVAGGDALGCQPGDILEYQCGEASASDPQPDREGENE